MLLKDLIAEHLKENRLSYRSFAKMCGISSAYLSMIKNDLNPSTGKPPVVTFETLSKIAKGMGMTTHQLFEVVDDMPVDIGEPPKRKADLAKKNPSKRALEVAKIYDMLEDHTREVIDAIFKIAMQNSKVESETVRALKDLERHKLENFSEQEKEEYKSRLLR